MKLPLEIHSKWKKKEKGRISMSAKAFFIHTILLFVAKSLGPLAVNKRFIYELGRGRKNHAI